LKVERGEGHEEEEEGADVHVPDLRDGEEEVRVEDDWQVAEGGPSCGYVEGAKEEVSGGDEGQEERGLEGEDSGHAGEPVGGRGEEGIGDGDEGVGDVAGGGEFLDLGHVRGHGGAGRDLEGDGGGEQGCDGKKEGCGLWEALVFLWGHGECDAWWFWVRCSM